MPGTFWKVLPIGFSVLFLAGCSPVPEQASSSDSYPLPMTFDWEPPVRLNVRESTKIRGRDVKVRYDLMVEEFDQMNGYLLLSFANVTPLELDGVHINMSAHPTADRQQMKSMLVDFYSRPGFIVTPEGRIAAFTDIEKSIRARVEITRPDDAESLESFYEVAITDQALAARLHNNSDAVWSCLVRPWLDFKTPLNERSEQAVSLVILEGAEPAPAIRTDTNNAFAKGSESFVELESETVSSGVELARVLQNLAQKMMGESGKLVNIEGVATATNVRTSKVRLDPANLRPQWARCDNELIIDSKDDTILPSASRTQTTEFDIQWL